MLTIFYRLSRLCLFSGLLYCGAIAQTERFIPDSLAAADLWHISDSAKLFVGASFYYQNPKDSIVVWLDTSDAEATGTLYFMVPGFADSALQLFTNRQYSSSINITKMLTKPINPGTEIFFKYKSMARKYPRYTGQNRLGIDPQNQAAYPGARFVSRDYGLKPGFGHRFAVAGRLDATKGAINDTIVFGFEDGGDTIVPGKDSLVVADFDFNDVIFRATGLHLNIETVPDSIAVVCKDTTRAGDSLLCKAEVWSDSAGIKIRSPQLDSLAVWKLKGNRLLGDTLANSAVSGSKFFLGRTAFEKFAVCATLTGTLIKDTLRSCKTVLVNPGSPSALSIEPRADSASSGFSLHAAVQLNRVQIPSNETSLSLYAIFRDMFGNFAGFASAAGWDTSSRSTLMSLKPGVATVKTGNSAQGECVVMKGVGSGDILVLAQSASGPSTLRDTVIVNVVTADYDSIRVCAWDHGALTPLSKCMLSMDQCTSFVSIGRRVDNGSWERITTQWQFKPWTGAPAAVLDSLRFCPNDTGTGSITVAYQGRLQNTLTVTVLPGVASALALYTARGTPFPPDTISIAGEPLIVYARIFDAHGYWLKNIPYTSLVWTITEGSAAFASADSAGHFSPGLGNPVTYIPVRARRNVTINAAYKNISDTVGLSIVPGKPYKLYIESSADWHSKPYAPDAIDTLEIPDDRTSAVVWALVRDSLGNFIDSLHDGAWGSSDTMLSALAGSLPGEGLLLKNLAVSQGICSIFAREKTGVLSDTAYVKLVPYHYTAVRIVDGKDASIDSLVMSTNDDTLLKAQALRSDTTLWCDVSAHWTASESFGAASAFAQTYWFSPSGIGCGFIAAAISGKETLSDTVPTVVTPGEPVRAELSLLTPHEKLIAGDTISAAVKIYNKDGLVPGVYCYGKGSAMPPAYYQDSLGYGRSGFTPQVLSGEARADLAAAPSLGAGINQCFHDGVDTVSLILFYAPLSKDSLHRIIVKLGGISARSAPLRLLPSQLASLSLAHSNYCCQDTLVLRYPKENAVVYAVGYDRFGNIRGEENCAWKTSGTLHPLPAAAATSRIMYSADSQFVKHDEEGALIATSSAVSSVSGSLWTLVVGPQASALFAITKDDDGDGVLDRITVGFSKSIYIRDSSLYTRFNVTYQGKKLEVSNVVLGADGASVDIHLKKQTNDSLQTDWTPDVSLDNKGLMLGGAVDSFFRRADDGAGPVIASVVKIIGGDDRKSDLVTVTFSEPITGRDGNALSYLIAPEQLFLTWLETATSTFMPITMLDGIADLKAPVEPARVGFQTTNGKELTNAHYFTIRADSSAFRLIDKAGNRPSFNNRKVKVIIQGNAPAKLVIAPNPSVPTPVREPPGQFHLQHNPSALQWAGSDQAGIVIKFQILIPQGSSTQIGGRIKIYDAVGNTVSADPPYHYQWKNIVKGGRIIVNENYSDIVPVAWTPNGTVYDFIVYWNGYTYKGMKVAPGVYQAILTLIQETNGRKETKTLTGIIGIKR